MLPLQGEGGVVYFTQGAALGCYRLAFQAGKAGST
jgi:hypothetical protein